MKLYPPYIEGTIPAFTTSGEGTTEIVVPFSLNKANTKASITGLQIKIKSVTNDALLGSWPASSFDLDAGTATFRANAFFRVNQFYKIQIAFKNNNEVGYYSTVGVVKATSKPIVKIDNLKKAEPNNNVYSFTGIYMNSDATEKLYSSCFKLTDSRGTIVETSGEIVHNAENDTSSFEAIENYILETDLFTLGENDNFYIEFSIQTVNGLTATSGKYIVRHIVIPGEGVKGDLTAARDYHNGCVEIEFKAYGKNYPPTGKFILSRAKIDDMSIKFKQVYRQSTPEASNKDISAWERIYNTNKACWKKIGEIEITVDNQKSPVIFTDYSVEQGVEYLYSIQRYIEEKDGYTSRALSEGVYADYEDIFLFDGEKQLKIRYNAKVSSLKTTILEQKTDTIGSKHPFIFRNGNVYYQEVPISGLITYIADWDEKFMTKDEYGMGYATTDITSENMAAERMFRQSVYEWLNNGKPKLFKSPTEGNYIVRLMNVSLSPMDQLGRMLYSFSCTGYEIADYNERELMKHNLINMERKEK